MKRIIVLAITVLALALSSGCSRSTLTRAESFLPAQAIAAQRPQTPYRIVAGDVLSFHFSYHPDMDSKATVRLDGHVGVIGLGEFRAAGRTTMELAEDVLSRARLTLRDPVLTIVITETAPRRVYVAGEVIRPGFVDLAPGLTSLRAIMARGGFRNTAKTDSVLHVAWLDGGRYSASRLDLEALIERGDAGADVAVGPNDIIFVPRTWIANADIWVNQYLRELIPIRQPTTRLPNIGE
ncbi:MAG: polysaccharide biosynthesis/export family protein [Candidatus Binatia bacterium]